MTMITWDLLMKLYLYLDLKGVGGYFWRRGVIGRGPPYFHTKVSNRLSERAGTREQRSKAKGIL